jgi:deoxynucleoside triphosphate triphosphohydrolase SAMHD1
MSIEDIRELQLSWFGNQRSPTEFSRRFESAFDRIGFSEEYVRRWLSQQGRRSGSTKVVKDNVWGMIELDESAIRLLDCPIVQRLRRVRQLGFSYLTYPSAEHSRFVHSLGMLGVISRFIDTASRASGPRNGTGEHYAVHEVPDADRLDLQHAALLHDSGHLPFSHASEFALESLPDVTTVGSLPLEDFFAAAEVTGLRRPKLAELLSVAIVLSPRFGHFYSEHVRPHEEDARTRKDAPLRLASLILGKPTNNINVAYAELISGHVIDADKLDYVSRDGMACGIPTGIDVGRLFLRSSFYRFEKDELNRLRKRFGYPAVDSEQVHFIVNSSGRDTIEELISARTSLYHRVYFHQTTRNAERMYEQLIERALDSSAKSGTFDSLEIWANSDEQMLATLAGSSDPVLSHLAIRVSSRQLPKRALVFGQSELAPITPLKSAFSTGRLQFDEAPLRLPHLKRFSKRFLYGRDLSTLEKAIANECSVLHRLIHDDLESTGVLPPVGSRPHVVISPAQFSPPVHDDCLVLQNRELVYSKELHNVTQTNDAEEIFRASGYVLTDDPWREIAFVAARKVLAERTKEWLRIDARVGGHRSMGDLAKRRAGVAPAESMNFNGSEEIEADAFTVLNLDHDKVIGRTNLDKRGVEMIETRAAIRGYFDKLPFLMCRPTIPWEHLHPKFERFEGQYGWRITRDVAEAFVWQFPPKFRSQACELLKSIDVLDANMSADLVHTALQSFRNSGRSRSKIRIAPLSPNSGQELRIALEHNFRSNEEFARNFAIHHSLEELLADDARAESPIALIDDNMVTGSQAFAQLASWYGIARERWPKALVGETNVDDAALNTESRAKLFKAISARRVGLCVSFGSAPMSLSYRKAFAELVEQDSSPLSGSEPGLFAGLGGTEMQLFVGRGIGVATAAFLRDKGFVTHLAEVGKSLQAWLKFGTDLRELSPADRKTCAANSLGYDNAKGLTFTFRNAPVSTLTCLWAPGRFRGLPWMPLGIRRGYAKRLILS